MANGIEPRTAAELPEWYRMTVDFITRVGFPVAVAAYVLHRLDKSIHALRDTLIDFIEQTNKRGE